MIIEIVLIQDSGQKHEPSIQFWKMLKQHLQCWSNTELALGGCLVLAGSDLRIWALDLVSHVYLVSREFSIWSTSLIKLIMWCYHRNNHCNQAELRSRQSWYAMRSISNCKFCSMLCVDYIRLITQNISNITLDHLKTTNLCRQASTVKWMWKHNTTCSVTDVERYNISSYWQ